MSSTFSLVFSRCFLIATTAIEMMISVTKISRIRPPIMQAIKIPAEKNELTFQINNCSYIALSSHNFPMNLCAYTHNTAIYSKKSTIFLYIIIMSDICRPELFIPIFEPLPPRSSDCIHCIVVLSSVKPSLHTEIGKHFLVQEISKHNNPIYTQNPSMRVYK